MTLLEMLDTMDVRGTVSLDVWDEGGKFVGSVGPRHDDNDIVAVDEFTPYHDFKVVGFRSGTVGDGGNQVVIDLEPVGESEGRPTVAPSEGGLSKVADTLARNVRQNLESHFRDDSWAAFLRVDTIQTVLSDLGIDCQLRCNHAYVNGVESSETF